MSVYFKRLLTKKIRFRSNQNRSKFCRVFRISATNYIIFFKCLHKKRFDKNRVHLFAKKLCVSFLLTNIIRTIIFQIHKHLLLFLFNTFPFLGDSSQIKKQLYLLLYIFRKWTIVLHISNNLQHFHLKTVKNCRQVQRLENYSHTTCSQNIF